MTLKIYDSDRVQVSFGGVPITGGWTDGDFLAITANEDAFTAVVGTSGEVSRSKTLNRSATIEINLMSTSPFNDIFSGIYIGDINAHGGAGVGEFHVVDLNGTSIHFAGNAWIRRPPDTTYGAEANIRTWTLECDRLETYTGGTL